MYYGLPTASFGQYRGSPGFMGEGTGQGRAVEMAGGNAFAAGQGPQSARTGWSPTILYLFVLVLVEMVVFGIISKHL